MSKKIIRTDEQLRETATREIHEESFTAEDELYLETLFDNPQEQERYDGIYETVESEIIESGFFAK